METLTKVHSLDLDNLPLERLKMMF